MVWWFLKGGDLKNTFSDGMHLDFYEQVSFKPGIMMDTSFDVFISANILCLVSLSLSLSVCLSVSLSLLCIPLLSVRVSVSSV